MWHNVAASQGDEDAVKVRNAGVKHMLGGKNTFLILEAQDLASECVEKKFKGCDRRKR
tara:strand:- start:167 stop:340 length:174 start_codon:yes stop_codon:yes gene_type:complete